MIDVTSLEQLDAAAMSFAGQIEAGSVYGLIGQLGAGKTTFVKHVARHLGITSDVISPTFMYEQLYGLPNPQRGILRLAHWDLYRLETDRDASDLGLEADDEQTVYLVEWIDHLPQLWARATSTLTFTLGSDGARTLEEVINA